MNPFVQNIKLEVTKYIEATNHKYQGMTNDEFYASKTERTERIFFVDRVHKTGVYHNPMDMEMLFNSEMTSAGRDVMYFIHRTLKKDADFITLDRAVACELMRCSRGSLLTGLKQLQKAGVIAQKSPREFWINPMHMFNGSRIEYFQSLAEHDAKLDIKFTKLLNP